MRHTSTNVKCLDSVKEIKQRHHFYQVYSITRLKKIDTVNSHLFVDELSTYDRENLPDLRNSALLTSSSRNRKSSHYFGLSKRAVCNLPRGEELQ